MSLVLCPMLTWSLGWIGLSVVKRSPPLSSIARLAITSLMFMLLDVPDPVWNTSMGNSSSSCPSMTSWHDASRASTWVLSSGFLPVSVSLPRSRLATAAARLTRPRAWTKSAGNLQPLIGKLSTARCVWAP